MSSNRVSNDFISDMLVLMQGIRDVLLHNQQSLTDTVIVNSIPSTTTATHNITGVYGCKHVVAFMSVMEGVLSKIRNDELLPKTELTALLLICCDHVSRMLSHHVHRDEIYLGDLKRCHGLIRQLGPYTGTRIKYATSA